MMAAENRNARDQRRFSTSRRNVMDPSNVESSQYYIVCGRRSTQVMGKYAKDGCEEYCDLGFGGSFHSGNESAY
uniref:Uncharacterized protein n=1 Tax=Ditylenchus dipsaci TaxID=166011 RepID=A0A915D5T6_9BILA